MQKVISTNTNGHVLGAEAHAYIHEGTKTSEGIFFRFIHWCDSQEQKKFMWMAISFLGSIGMVLPLTLYSIVFFGQNNFTLWIIVCAVNVPVLALNLAAQPTKVTLPSLFFAWAVNVCVVLYSLVTFL